MRQPGFRLLFETFSCFRCQSEGSRPIGRWRGLPLLFLLISLLLSSMSVQAASPVIRFGVASAPLNLDPRFASDAVSVRLNRLFYQRLVEMDAASMPRPGVADWQVITPTHYRFRLNDKVGEFPDGARLDGYDVEATYRFALDPANASPLRTAIAMIERVVALDGNTIDFHLSRPDPLFPAHLDLDILPARLLAQKHAFEQRPMGSGRFRFLDRPDPGRLLIQRRSDQQPIEIVEVKNPTVRVLKLLRGEIDLLQNDLSPELLDYLRSKSTVQVTQCAGSNFSYIGFNLQDAAVGDLRVRQAIAHAIDRRSIIKYVMRGAAREAETLFPPEHWAGHGDLTAYTYDPAESRRLLREAGYGDDHPLTLIYKTSSDPFRIRLATIIQSQLRDVGIGVDLRSYDWGTFFGDIKAGNFQFYSLSWVGVRTPDSFRYLFASDALPPTGANRGRYRNSQVDRLIEQAEQADTLEAQAPLYLQLETLLHEDLPYVPLWYEDQYAAMGNGVKGYHVSADGNYDGLMDLIRTDSLEPAHATASIAD